jgi:hypothetical protein
VGMKLIPVNICVKVGRRCLDTVPLSMSEFRDSRPREVPTVELHLCMCRVAVCSVQGVCCVSGNGVFSTGCVLCVG